MVKIAGSEHTPQLSQQELDLIERFRTTYRAIEKHLRHLLRKGQESNASLTSLAAEYARMNKRWSAEAEYLKRVGDLRNVLDNRGRLCDHSRDMVRPQARRETVVHE